MILPKDLNFQLFRVSTLRFGVSFTLPITFYLNPFWSGVMHTNKLTFGWFPPQEKMSHGGFSILLTVSQSTSGIPIPKSDKTFQ